MSATSPIVFLLPGQGSHYLRMGAELFARDPVFKRWMSRLDEVVKDEIQTSVIDRLYRGPEVPAGQPFSRTRESHPAIFMVELALGQSLIERGVRPDVVLGVSLGEYVAAALAGVLAPEAALRALLRQACALEASCPPGGMLAVLGDAGTIQREVGAVAEDQETGAPSPAPGLTLAGQSGSFHCVLAGRDADLRAAAERLRLKGMAAHSLPVERAFHSALIDPARAACLADLRALTLRAPEVTFIAGRDGGERDRLSAEELWSAVRAPMRFFPAVERLLAAGAPRFIDLGPSGSLANLIKLGVPGDCSPDGRRPPAAPFSVLTPYGGEVARLEAIVGAAAAHVIRAPRRPMTTKSEAHPVTQPRNAMKLAYVFPGQGTQRKGMGASLFGAFPELVDQASQILGYSLTELCLSDPLGRLSQTQYTQPAIYVVNALGYLARQRDGEPAPDFLAGHSLGEYNALLVAESFDFETGLRLVKRRGELMGEVEGGGMAAVLGLSPERVLEILRSHAALQALDVANFNSPEQVVIAGPAAVVRSAQAVFEAAGAKGFVVLRVSAAFHSRYMSAAAQNFAHFLASFELRPPRIPVISNAEAIPYDAGRIREILAMQIARPVRWIDTVRYLRRQSDLRIVEMGGTGVLTAFLRDFPAESPVVQEVPPSPAPRGEGSAAQRPASIAPAPASASIAPAALGSAEFRADYGIRYAYVCGAMYRGIASSAMVLALARAGMLGYFGAGGLSIAEIEAALDTIQRELRPDQPYGMNLLSTTQDSQLEEATVDLYLRRRVRHVEAASYMIATPALVRYRIAGLEPDGATGAVARNRIMAKVSRPEIAEMFLRPPPARIVAKLLADGRITGAQAMLAERVPLADDLCVEADSGGHTDRGVASALTPTIARLRDRICAAGGYRRRVRVGAAGGIGTPEAVAAAFALGADFVLTGSINQCTVEAGTSDAVKDLLQGLDVQDFDHAPAGDLFEIGARVQVVKKGLFFAARANKLYDLYRAHESLDQIDAKTRDYLERVCFRRSIEGVYEDVKAYYPPAEIARAEAVPKYKMALVFKWYFGYSSRLALTGAPQAETRVDYQVHSGPAMGAFNRYVEGTPLASWRARRVAAIGELLIEDAARLLSRRVAEWAAAVQPAIPNDDRGQEQVRGAA